MSLTVQPDHDHDETFSANKRLVVLVPFRDRHEHLGKFVPHLDRVLDTQAIDFEMLVIEQVAGRPFNRAKLLNVGFVLTRDNSDYCCFHDVDMLPEGSQTDYRWVNAPTHLAGCASQYDYRLPYPTYFGGVTLFNKDHFERINGFSNEYWGWGLEDDDLFLRCRRAGLPVYRRPGRYRSLAHESNKNPQSPELQANRHRWQRFSNGELSHENDGLNSLTYHVVDRQIVNEYCEQVTVDI